MTAPREYVAVPGDARRAAKAILSRRYRNRKFWLCLLVAPSFLAAEALVIRAWWPLVPGFAMALLIWLPARRFTVKRMRAAYPPGALWRVSVTEDEVRATSPLSDSRHAWAEFSAAHVTDGFVVLTHRNGLFYSALPAVLFEDADLAVLRRGIAEERRTRPMDPGSGWAPERTVIASDAFRRGYVSQVQRRILRSPVILVLLVVTVPPTTFLLLIDPAPLPLLVLLLLGLLVPVSRFGARRAIGKLCPPGSTLGLSLRPDCLVLTDPGGSPTAIPLARIASVKGRGALVLLRLHDQSVPLVVPRDLLDDSQLEELSAAVGGPR